jgi:hypothetical protein
LYFLKYFIKRLRGDEELLEDKHNRDKPTVNETIAENILPYATTNLRTAYKDTPTRIAKVGIFIGSGANECLFVLLCPPVSHTV